jgi:hypothetical protein
LQLLFRCGRRRTGFFLSIEILAGVKPDHLKSPGQTDPSPRKPSVQIGPRVPLPTLYFIRIEPERSLVIESVNHTEFHPGFWSCRKLEQSLQPVTRLYPDFFTDFTIRTLVVTLVNIDVPRGGGIPQPGVSVFGIRAVLQEQSAGPVIDQHMNRPMPEAQPVDFEPGTPPDHAIPGIDDI